MTQAPRFAHASEAELARILDYYGVRWEYEPRTFPILWNSDGKVVESFSPDFFLPDMELYVELTTLKQSLVRRKNRKLRRLRELYPDVRVKLFYGKDFRALMLKYGKFDVAASLSGLEGQLMPERAPRPVTPPQTPMPPQTPVTPVAVIPDPMPPREAVAATDTAQPLPTERRSRFTPVRSRVSRGTRRRRGRRAFAATLAANGGES